MGKDLVTGQLGSVLCWDWGALKITPVLPWAHLLCLGLPELVPKFVWKLEAASDPGLAWAHGSHLGSVGDVEIEA